MRENSIFFQIKLGQYLYVPLKISAAVPPFFTSCFLKKNIGLSWCLQQPEGLLMLCLHKGLIIQAYI